MMLYINLMNSNIVNIELICQILEMLTMKLYLMISHFVILNRNTLF